MLPTAAPSSREFVWTTDHVMKGEWRCVEFRCPETVLHKEIHLHIQ